MKASQVYRRLLKYALPYWWAILLGVVGTVLSSGTDAGFAYILKPLLDKGFIAKDHNFLKWLPLGIFVAFLLRGLAAFMSDYFMTLAARNVVLTFRQKIFAHLLKLPASFHDNANAGQLLSTLIYNVEQVAKASTDALLTVVRETCLVLGLLVVMLLTSVKLTLLFLVSTPVIAFIARYSSLRMRKLSQNLQESMGQITHVAQESLDNYKVIRIFGGEQYENNKFNEITFRNWQRELKVIVTNSLASSTVQQIAAIVIAVMIYFATNKHAHITAGGFTSMVAAMMALLKPMRNLTNVNSNIQRGIAAAISLFAILDEPTEKDTGTQSLATAQGHISFEQVSFAYQADQPILKNIDFTILPGQTVALVGRSGAGKSSLINLLPRFYDHYQGAIKLDHHELRELKLADLRRQFAIVTQQVNLFNDTIARNIAYGCGEEITESQILAAAKAAHALEFIEKLPNGIHSVVGNQGVLLSGGQRQRIAIARALLKNAPILILDEATSALDTESEHYIQQALETIMRDRTTFVIAHRLSTIENADMILVMDKGEIVERGSHQELLAQNGYYARLHTNPVEEVTGA